VTKIVIYLQKFTAYHNTWLFTDIYIPSVWHHRVEMICCGIPRHPRY